MTKFKLRRRIINLAKRLKYHVLGLLFIAAIWYWFCLPEKLFSDPVSTVIVDRNGKLLGARIARDGQWRFPEVDSVPMKIKTALLTFEDKRFHTHPGIDFLAIGRAIRMNIRNKEVVSGASTITMQVIRLARKGQGRTFMEKIIEMILATRLEIREDKDQILELYCSYAPFGGNVVGLEAASWKYYGRASHNLSWAEAATLAVLPNSPSLIHPGKNRALLRAKRNKLLAMLHKQGHLDKLSYQLACSESLPDKPLALPAFAPHLLDRIQTENKKHLSIYETTLDRNLQERVTEIVNRHSKGLERQNIHNAAALVIDVNTGNALAYIGNCRGRKHGRQVDMIKAPRSTGSIIKPLLYASMLNDGQILPSSIVPDVPSNFHGYSPKNFDYQYLGAVHANEALARSLNIPAVHMLADYGYKKFFHKAKDLGMTTLTKSADHYGLSLILGGAETTMQDLGRIYASMARDLKYYARNNGQYFANNYGAINLLAQKKEANAYFSEHARLSASSIWHTFKSMVEVARPGEQRFWRNFNSSTKIAWKTGTSFGFRDAWAVGISPHYVVVTWVGNADGEGQPDLVGARVAGPLLFDIFNAIQFTNDWFEPPYDDMRQISICQHSGMRALSNCVDTLSIDVPINGLNTAPCPYCHIKHLDSTENWQVSSNCYPVSDMKRISFFELPAKMEHYYKSSHPKYKSTPPFLEGCNSTETARAAPLQFVYPNSYVSLYIPIDLNETSGSVVFEATHKQKEAKLFWHLDEEYIGETQFFHQMKLNPAYGKHKITIVDESGESVTQKFEVISKNN